MSNPVRVNYCMYCMEALAEGEVICPKCGYDNRNMRNGPGQLPYTVLAGKYLVGRSLGQGGFGITYIGFELNLLMKVAIKEYFPKDIVARDDTGTLSVVVTSDKNQPLFSKGRERFLREARTLAKLDDCGLIVHVRDFFQEHGTAYIVMDYIEGTPLSSYIAPFPLCMTFEEVVRLLSPLLTQLDEVHSKQILHRDISPDNIVIRGNNRPVLIDFGSAREDADESHSQDTTAYVKQGYSPAEQYSSGNKQEASTDVYAMTATLYSLLCGVRPAASIAIITGDKRLIPPTELNPTLTKAQEQVLLKGMSPRAQDRYQSMGALNAALNAALNDALTGARATPPTLRKSPAPYSPLEPTTIPKPRGKGGIIAIVSAAVAVIALAIAFVPGLMNRMDDQLQNVMPLGTAMPAATSTPIPGLAPTPTPTDAPAANVDWSQWDFASTPTDAPVDNVDWSFDVEPDEPVPTLAPTAVPTATPTVALTATPTAVPTATPTAAPTATPTAAPTATPTAAPTAVPTTAPTAVPTAAPTAASTNASIFEMWETATPQPAPISYTLMNEDGVFGNAEYARDQIHTITFLDTLVIIPPGAWDVSVEQTGGIMAWVEKENGQNNLYIASNGVIQANEDSSGLFDGYANVREIYFNGRLDTSNVTNMEWMFNKCSSLTQLDVSSFDTRNIANMRGMFNACSSLTQLDVSNFDTRNVTNMYAMFNECSSLTQLDVSNFDTVNATEMRCMFRQCTSLAQLDVSGFDTRNATDMWSMFERCSSLTQLDVRNFDTGNVTDMCAMFEGCSSLTQLDVSSFDTGNVTRMTTMFAYCSSLTQLDVTNFDTSTVAGMYDMYCMFEGCSSLTRLDVSNFDTRNVTNMYSMFTRCSSLTQLDVSNFDTGNVTNMCSMFSECSSLTQLDVSNYDTRNVTAMHGMFRNCSHLRTITGKKALKGAKGCDKSGMYYNCPAGN